MVSTDPVIDNSGQLGHGCSEDQDRCASNSSKEDCHDVVKSSGFGSRGNLCCNHHHSRTKGYKVHAASQTDPEIYYFTGSLSGIQPETSAHVTPKKDEGMKSEGTLRLMINNFKNMSNTIRGPPKAISGVPWKIMVMPRQHVVAKKGTQKCLGFFLQCCPESYSDSWSCQAVAELRLIAQKTSVPNFIRKTNHVYTAKENDWGYSCFMTWLDILDENQGYIKDEKVILEVFVKADLPKGILTYDAFCKKIQDYMRLADLQRKRGLIDKALEVNQTALKFCKEKDPVMREELESQKAKLIELKLKQSIERIEKGSVKAEGGDPSEDTAPTLRQAALNATNKMKSASKVPGTLVAAGRNNASDSKNGSSPKTPVKSLTTYSTGNEDQLLDPAAGDESRSFGSHGDCLQDAKDLINLPSSDEKLNGPSTERANDLAEELSSGDNNNNDIIGKEEDEHHENYDLNEEEAGSSDEGTSWDGFNEEDVCDSCLVEKLEHMRRAGFDPSALSVSSGFVGDLGGLEQDDSGTVRAASVADSLVQTEDFCTQTDFFPDEQLNFSPKVISPWKDNLQVALKENENPVNKSPLSGQKLNGDGLPSLLGRRTVSDAASLKTPPRVTKTAIKQYSNNLENRQSGKLSLTPTSLSPKDGDACKKMVSSVVSGNNNTTFSVARHKSNENGNVVSNPSGQPIKTSSPSINSDGNHDRAAAPAVEKLEKQQPTFLLTKEIEHQIQLQQQQQLAGAPDDLPKGLSHEAAALFSAAVPSVLQATFKSSIMKSAGGTRSVDPENQRLLQMITEESKQSLSSIKETIERLVNLAGSGGDIGSCLMMEDLKHFAKSDGLGLPPTGIPLPNPTPARDSNSTKESVAARDKNSTPLFGNDGQPFVTQSGVIVGSGGSAPITDYGNAAWTDTFSISTALAPNFQANIDASGRKQTARRTGKPVSKEELDVLIARGVIPANFLTSGAIPTQLLEELNNNQHLAGLINKRTLAAPVLTSDKDVANRKRNIKPIIKGSVDETHNATEIEPAIYDNSSIVQTVQTDLTYPPMAKDFLTEEQISLFQQAKEMEARADEWAARYGQFIDQTEANRLAETVKKVEKRMKDIEKQTMTCRKELSDECERHHREEQRLVKSNKFLETQLHQSNEKIEKLNTQLKEKCTQLKEKRTEIKKLDKKLKSESLQSIGTTEMQSKVDQLEKDLAISQKKHSDEVKKMNRELQKLKDEKRQLQDELSGATSEIETLTYQLDEKSTVQKRLENSQKSEKQHTQTILKEALERAKKSEINLLDFKLEMGLTICNRALNECEQNIAQTEGILKRMSQQTGPSDQMQAWSQYLDQWIQNRDKLKETMNRSKSDFENQLEQIRSGKALSALPHLDCPSPPQPPPPPKFSTPPPSQLSQPPPPLFEAKKITPIGDHRASSHLSSLGSAVNNGINPSISPGGGNTVLPQEGIKFDKQVPTGSGIPSNENNGVLFSSNQLSEPPPPILLPAVVGRSHLSSGKNSDINARSGLGHGQLHTPLGHQTGEESLAPQQMSLDGSLLSNADANCTGANTGAPTWLDSKSEDGVEKEDSKRHPRHPGMDAPSLPVGHNLLCDPVGGPMVGPGFSPWGEWFKDMHYLIAPNNGASGASLGGDMGLPAPGFGQIRQPFGAVNENYSDVSMPNGKFVTTGINQSLSQSYNNVSSLMKGRSTTPKRGEGGWGNGIMSGWAGFHSSVGNNGRPVTMPDRGKLHAPRPSSVQLGTPETSGASNPALLTAGNLTGESLNSGSSIENDKFAQRCDYVIKQLESMYPALPQHSIRWYIGEFLSSQPEPTLKAMSVDQVLRGVSAYILQCQSNQNGMGSLATRPLRSEESGVAADSLDSFKATSSHHGLSAMGNPPGGTLEDSPSAKQVDDKNSLIGKGEKCVCDVPLKMSTPAGTEKESNFRRQEVKTLDCNHTFHVSCLKQWLCKQSPGCPACGQYFPPLHDFPELSDGREESSQSGPSGTVGY